METGLAPIHPVVPMMPYWQRLAPVIPKQVSATPATRVTTVPVDTTRGTKVDLYA